MRIPMITTVYGKNDEILEYDVTIDTKVDGSTLTANLKVSPESFDLSPLKAEVNKMLATIINEEGE